MSKKLVAMKVANFMTELKQLCDKYNVEHIYEGAQGNAQVGLRLKKEYAFVDFSYRGKFEYDNKIEPAEIEFRDCRKAWSKLK